MARDDDSNRSNTARVLDHDDVEGVLSGRFYSAPAPEPSRTRVQEKPAHYKVICISMYTKDLARLDDLVEMLKSKGVAKAKRRRLIRGALD